MKIQINKSFAFKLSLYIMACVVLTFLIVLIYNYRISKNTILENIRENVRLLASSTINRINTTLTAAKKVPENLSYILECTNLTEKQILELLKNVVQNNHEIYGSAITFEPYMFEKDRYLWGPYYCKTKGTVQYTDLGNEKYDYLKWDWYTLPKKLNKGIWSEPYFDEGGGNTLMVTYSQPFYKDINGLKKFYGAVTCDIDIDWLVKLTSKIKIFKTGYAYILSPKGTFIAHPNKEYYTKGLSHFAIADKHNDPLERSIGEKMTNGQIGFLRYYSYNMKKNCYVYFEPLESTGWSIGIVIPEEELFSELNTTVSKLFSIGLAGCILTLLLIILLSSKATIPLRRLAAATYKIGLGEFDAEIPEVKSSDEVGALSRSFHVMQDNLVNYIHNLKETSKELALTQEVTIECMASVAEFRDPETGMHIRRTQIYVKELAIHLRNHPRFKDYLDDKTIEMLYLSAPLHDIGKVGIPDNILLKTGKLTDEEFTAMKKHTIYGRDAISESEKKLTKSSFLKIAKDMAASHHEKWDGTGYPFALKEDEIPIPGRLMAVADVFDALISTRVYKPAFSHEKAVRIIKEGKGTHFDPDVVDAFLALESKFRKIALQMADKSEPIINHEIKA